jgi:hypothetical protein
MRSLRSLRVEGRGVPPGILKTGAENGLHQIRQIYADRQARSAEIWRRNHREDAHLWRIEPTRGPLLPFFSKMGWHPFLCGTLFLLSRAILTRYAT